MDMTEKEIKKLREAASEPWEAECCRTRAFGRPGEYDDVICGLRGEERSPTQLCGAHIYDGYVDAEQAA